MVYMLLTFLLGLSSIMHSTFHPYHMKIQIELLIELDSTVDESYLRVFGHIGES